MQDNLDTDLLRTLVAIADTGSFTCAARRVFRTPSAVSMQMKRLEGIAGRALFEKRGRRTQLNAGGRDLLQHARRILELHDEAVTALRAPGSAHEVRLGACQEYASSVVPPILARYAQRYPDVHVRLESRCSASLVAAAAAERIDIALVNVMSEEVRHEKLAIEPLVWVGGREHAAHESTPLRLALENECVWSRWAHEALERVGLTYRDAYSTLNAGGLVALVEAGLAVSVMPRGSVPPALRVLGEAEGFPPLPSTSMGLVRRGGTLTAPAEALVEQLREALGAERTAA